MWLYGVTVKVAPIQANTPPISTLLSPTLGPTNNMASGMDRNRNNAQFMSLMASMFGPQMDVRPQPIAPPVVVAPPQPTTPQPDVMGLLMSIMQANQSTLASSGTQAAPSLTSPMQQQSVMTLINQIAQQQIAQHYPVPNVSSTLQNGPNAAAETPLNTQLTSANLPENGSVNISENILHKEVIETDNQAKEILVKTEPKENLLKLEAEESPEVKAKPEKEEKPVEATEDTANPPAELTIEKEASTTNLQTTGLSKSVGATPSRYNSTNLSFKF